MWERILTILKKEFRSVLRDPRMRMVIIGMPVIQTKTGVGSAIDVYSGIQSLLIRVSTNIKGLGVTKNRSSPFNVA